jgi:hypothetical protein
VLLEPLRLFLSILPIVDGCKPMSAMQKERRRTQPLLGNICAHDSTGTHQHSLDAVLELVAES